MIRKKQLKREVESLRSTVQFYHSGAMLGRLQQENLELKAKIRELERQAEFYFAADEAFVEIR